MFIYIFHRQIEMTVLEMYLHTYTSSQFLFAFNVVLDT